MLASQSPGDVDGPQWWTAACDADRITLHDLSLGHHAGGTLAARPAGGVVLFVVVRERVLHLLEDLQGIDVPLETEEIILGPDGNPLNYQEALRIATQKLCRGDKIGLRRGFAEEAGRRARRAQGGKNCRAAEIAVQKPAGVRLPTS